MEQCEEHTELVSNIAVIKNTVINLDKRINGSIDAIEKHIQRGVAYRIGIISVGAMFILQTLILASMWGRLCKTVEVDTKRIDILEEIHPRNESELPQSKVKA